MKKIKLFLLILLAVIFLPWPTSYAPYRYVDQKCAIKYGIERTYSGINISEKYFLGLNSKAEAIKQINWIDSYCPLAWVLCKNWQRPKAKRMSTDQMEKISIDQLIVKLGSEIWQERVDAAYIAGVKRPHELEIDHIPALLQGIMDSRESLAFQCAYALERMGKKARGALPVLNQIEPEFRGEFAYDILMEAVSSIISGISAEDVMRYPNVFQVVNIQKGGSEMVLRRGFLAGNVFQVKIPDRYRGQLKPFEWIILHEKNGGVEITLLKKN